MEQPGGSGSLTGTAGEEREKEKRRWVDLFDRESHRQFYMEYLRDQHYEDIISTLRRSVSAQEGRPHHHNDVADKNDGVDDDLTVHSAPSFHLRIPPEQYFLTPDPALHAFYGPPFFTSGLAAGRGGGGVFGGRSGPFATAASSATTYSSSTTTISASELSLAPSSTLAASGPVASRKWLPPEVVAEKQRSRRRRTAVYVCFGVLSLAVAALTVGVVLHFLLETGSLRQGAQGSDPGVPASVQVSGVYSTSGAPFSSSAYVSSSSSPSPSFLSSLLPVSATAPVHSNNITKTTAGAVK